MEWKGRRFSMEGDRGDEKQIIQNFVLKESLKRNHDFLIKYLKSP